MDKAYADIYNTFCVDFLKASGWLDNHDKQIREDAIKEFVDAYVEEVEQEDIDEICDGCMKTDDFCCIKCFRDRYLESEVKEQSK